MLPARSRPVSRFFSLNSRSSSRPDILAEDRANSDLSRQETPKQNGISNLAPRLDLGFEVEPSEVEQVAGPSRLEGSQWRAESTKQEQEFLKKQTFTCAEVTLAWRWFGRLLVEMGESPPLFRPPGVTTADENIVNILSSSRKTNEDTFPQQRLISLYCLAVRPASISILPSISSQFPQSPSSDQAGMWSERLQDAIIDTVDTADLLDSLKWILRRFDNTQSTFGHSSNVGILSQEVYARFSEAERMHAYPAEGYDTLFRAHLDADVRSYLDEVFMVWSAAVEQSDLDRQSIRTLCALLGWWTLGCGGGRRALTWKELYRKWDEARRQMEHIFYAWIR